MAPAYKLDVWRRARYMFIANNPSSGDGDDYAIGTLESDYSAWINIFNNGWISGNNGWGTFWAGNSGARYRRVSSDNNPNEYVFVGAGNKRCTFDLDNGHTYLDGTLHNNSYDYAEYFEWEDGNPENEDRRGYSVVLASDGKIRKATSDDSPEDIIGAVSGTSSITGDAAMYDWNGKYEVDEWGTRVKDKVYQLTWEVELENGEKRRITVMMKIEYQKVLLYPKMHHDVYAVEKELTQNTTKQEFMNPVIREKNGVPLGY